LERDEIRRNFAVSKVNKATRDRQRNNSINNLNKRKEKNYGNNTSSNEGTGLQGS
jgi:hypothetical protein